MKRPREGIEALIREALREELEEVLDERLDLMRDELLESLAVRLAAQQPSQEPRPLMTKREVARYLRVDERTIDRLVKAGQLPEPHGVGSRPRWRPDSLPGMSPEQEPVWTPDKTGPDARVA